MVSPGLAVRPAYPLCPTWFQALVLNLWVAAPKWKAEGPVGVGEGGGGHNERQTIRSVEAEKGNIVLLNSVYI